VASPKKGRKFSWNKENVFLGGMLRGTEGQVLRALGLALGAGRSQSVKDACTILLAGLSDERPLIDVQAQLGIPPFSSSLIHNVALGGGGFHAMVLWFLAAASHQRHQHADSIQHAKHSRQLFLQGKRDVTHQRSLLPTRKLLQAAVNISEVTSSYHEMLQRGDFSAIQQLSKKLNELLLMIEDQEPSLQCAELQLSALLNLSIVCTSAGDSHRAETAIETLLKKAVLLHLILGSHIAATGSSKRSDDEDEDTIVIESVSIGLIKMARAYQSSLGEPREGNTEKMQNEVWEDRQQEAIMMERIDQIVMKALHLLAMIDVSSSTPKRWRRAERILHAISLHSKQDVQKRSKNALVALPILRCYFPRVLTGGELSCENYMGMITQYFLGIAHHLCGDTEKAIAVLAQTHSPEALYFLGYLHLQNGNFQDIPPLLESSINRENPLALEFLNLVAIAYSLQNKLEQSVGALKQTIEEPTNKHAQCSLFNLMTIYGRMKAYKEQKKTIDVLLQAKAHLLDYSRPLHLLPMVLENHQQPALFDAHYVPALAIEYASAKFALVQLDHDAALLHYRLIVKQMHDISPNELPVPGVVVWREYLECLVATGAHVEVP